MDVFWSVFHLAEGGDFSVSLHEYGKVTFTGFL